MRELTIGASIDNISQATDFINEMLEENDCNMKTQMQIELALDEIITNVASYAYKAGEGPLTICADIIKEPLSISISFIDKGIPYNPLLREDPDTTLSAEERGIGGLGIFLVKKTMDKTMYEYKDGQNILTIVKNL